MTEISPAQLEDLKLLASAYSEIDVLNRRIDRLLEVDRKWYELQGWLRLCGDDPEGHAEFYRWADYYMFDGPMPEE